MSLTGPQRTATERELRANFEQAVAQAAATPEGVCAALGFDARELEDVLEMARGVNPVSVWKLKDFLDVFQRERGVEPLPYSVLKVNRYYPY